MIFFITATQSLFTPSIPRKKTSQCKLSMKAMSSSRFAVALIATPAVKAGTLAVSFSTCHETTGNIVLCPTRRFFRLLHDGRELDCSPPGHASPCILVCVVCCLNQILLAHSSSTRTTSRLFVVRRGCTTGQSGRGAHNQERDVVPSVPSRPSRDASARPRPSTTPSTPCSAPSTCSGSSRTAIAQNQRKPSLTTRNKTASLASVST